MENNEGKSIMENANENRNQLVETLKEKIEELERIITDINSDENYTIKKYINTAQEYDVNYVPNRDVIQELLQLKGDLYIVQEKLQSLSLTKGTIFDEDEYLIKAEKLLGKIDSMTYKKIKKFSVLNRKKLEEAHDRKIQIKIGLSNSEIKLNHVKLEIENLEEQNSEIKNGLIYRMNISIFNKKNDAKIEENNRKIAELDKKKRDLEAKINKLKMQKEAEHFVPTPETQDSDEKTNEKEDKEAELDKE